MRTLTTVVIAGFTLMLIAGCSSHEMMDTPMDTKMTSMEEPMDVQPVDTMDATSDNMMQDNTIKTMQQERQQ